VHAQDRFKTLLVIVTGLLVLALIFKISWLIYLSAAVGASCILSETAARGIEWAWLKLATFLGWLNSRIILSLIYFAFLLPLAWISRLFTKDPLTLHRKKTASLFVTRNHQYTGKDLENIW
jgi:hypothetical protein